MGKLDGLREQFQKALSDARDFSAKVEEENRDFSAEEREQVKKMLDDAKALKEQIREAEGDNELRKSIETLGDGISLTEEKSDGGAVDLAALFRGAKRDERKSVGETFVGSDAYKNFMGQFTDGRIPDRASVKTAPVPFRGFKDLLTGASDTSGGAFVQTDYTGIYEGIGGPQLTLRGIISVRQTNSDLVEYVRQTTRTNNADTVAEATTSAGPTANTTTGVLENAAGAGLKPESAYAFEKVTAAVKTIAHWVPATRRAVSDAAQLRGLIDQELRDGLEETLEEQIVNGGGTGEDFEGIATVSGVQPQAWDTDILTTTRKARTKVRTVGRSTPTAYLLNPADWERLDLTTDGTDRYYFGGPQNMGTPRLWGLPVVESEAVTAGTGYVGDFRRCVLWDREQATIQVSDSHADFFIRNMVAILAEMRAAFGVTKPSALVEIDLTA